jgi:hypothetical protein
MTKTSNKATTVTKLMDSRVLALFALAATQDGFIRDLLPDTGSPDLKKNFGRLGLADDILNDFIRRVGGSSNRVRDAFLALNDILRIAYSGEYQPPDCPYTQVLKDVVTLTNDSQVILAQFQTALKKAAL